MGRLSNVPVDIDGVRSLADFEVIEIIDDSNPFPTLLGIDWAFDNLDVINLKKKQMTFEGHNIRIIAPLDPSMDPCYIEPIRVEEEARDIDDFYKVTSTQDDYINPTANGMLSWRYASSYTSDSDEGLVNWHNQMHELSGRHCVHLTKSLCWIGTKVDQVPVFDGLSNIKEFLKEYEAQVPSSQRLQALDVALRATSARWWVAHKKNITTWETCHRLLIIRFGEDVGAMNYRYDGQTDPRVHIESCVKEQKHCSADEWVHLFVHTLDTSPRN